VWATIKARKLNMVSSRKVHLMLVRTRICR
jgi:hypothetical protein